jgi:hypothetical protein
MSARLPVEGRRGVVCPCADDRDVDLARISHAQHRRAATSNVTRERARTSSRSMRRRVSAGATFAASATLGATSAVTPRTGVWLRDGEKPLLRRHREARRDPHCWHGLARSRSRALIARARTHDRSRGHGGAVLSPLLSSFDFTTLTPSARSRRSRLAFRSPAHRPRPCRPARARWRRAGSAPTSRVRVVRSTRMRRARGGAESYELDPSVPRDRRRGVDGERHRDDDGRHQQRPRRRDPHRGPLAGHLGRALAEHLRAARPGYLRRIDVAQRHERRDLRGAGVPQCDRGRHGRHPPGHGLESRGSRDHREHGGQSGHRNRPGRRA